MGRPVGRARIVEVRGKTYEVLELRTGERKIFRLELEYVQPGSPEHQLVQHHLERTEAPA